MLATIDLITESVVAIITTEIKASIGVEVLNDKLEAHVAGAGTHSLELARIVVAGEHAAGVVASVVDEGTGFFSVGPVLTRAVTGGGNSLGAQSEEAGNSGDGGGLHCGIGVVGRLSRSIDG